MGRNSIFTYMKPIKNQPNVGVINCNYIPSMDFVWVPYVKNSAGKFQGGRLTYPTAKGFKLTAKVLLFFVGTHVSNEKNPGWLGYKGDYTGIIINHYKDPY